MCEGLGGRVACVGGLKTCGRLQAVRSCNHGFSIYAQLSLRCRGGAGAIK